MTEPDNSNKASVYTSIIQSVRTPLGFFTLAVLVVEGVLGITAGFSQGQDRTYLVIGMVVLVFFLILIVAGMAVFRPEALSGARPSKVVAVSPARRTPSAISSETSTSMDSTDADDVDPKLVHLTPPLHPSRFKIVDLPQHQPPKYYDWPYSPTGLIIAYQIPFFLLPVHDSGGNPRGHLAINIQPTRENVAVSESIDVMARDISFAHFLLSAGHGWRTIPEGVQFLYRRIGYIQLQFSDGTDQIIPLTLGKNIREWAFGNSPNLVTEIDLTQTKPAWLSHDSTRRIDLMSVSVVNAPKTVRAIQVTAKFEDDHPGKLIDTPAIIVSAITLERSV